MRRSVQIISVVVLAVLAAFIIFFYYRNLRAPLPSIDLPSVTQGNSFQQPDPESDLLGNQARLPVSITTETVQAVVATLARPESYDRSIEINTYWSGGSSTSIAQVWVDDGYTLTALMGENTYYTLVKDETLYQWFLGDTTYHTSSADYKSADLGQRIATYEDILQASASEITDASYVEWNGLSCVYAEIYAAEYDQWERYWVSVPTGLLVHSETVRESQVLYEMSSDFVNQPVANGTSFALPDGTVLHEAFN